MHPIAAGDERDGARPGTGHDVRMAAVGAACWLGGIAVHETGALAVALAAVLGAAAAALARHGRTAVARLLVACALACGAVVAAALLRAEVVAGGVVPALAEERARAQLTGMVVSDPVTSDGPFGPRVAVRLRVEEVSARGSGYRTGTVVLVLGDLAWSGAELGARVRTSGRMLPADSRELGGVVVSATAPVRIRGPDVWWRATAALRASIRAAVADRPADQRALVPALVVGDDAGLSEGLEDDFRTTGLTHLTAVSGTNLTLVVGFLLLVARGCGVRGRWLHLVGLAGVVGFVALARTEPSVLRAAAMGIVGLFALGTDGRRRGLRALGVAVCGLLLLSPPLAVSAGFALSVLATGGIVVLAPQVQTALAQWLPGPVAAAVAVPFAAQLACTPVVAALSGEISLVAVVANVLVSPVVGPATVLGLAGGVVGLAWEGGGRLPGTAAALCVGWVVLVAEHGADLPEAAVAWGSGVLPITALAGGCVALALLAPAVLRRPRVGGAVVAASLVVVLGIPGCLASLPSGWTPGGWPPAGWALVACDVGQGDALAVAVGPQAAVVVDAGPDPDRVDSCLDRLGITVVPLVVLTHFHADHVVGLEGVLRDRRVGTVEGTPVLDPAAGVASVQQTAAEGGVPLAVAPYGVTRRFGAATIQVLWPDEAEPRAGPGDGSAANDASVVLLVESGGLRMLLTGDVEPPGQHRLAAALTGLDIDVLKVPHHGSRYQDLDWLLSLDAEVALVSVGSDNDYGHPDPTLLDALTGADVQVARTDRDGSVAVTAGEDGPTVVTSD